MEDYKYLFKVETSFAADNASYFLLSIYYARYLEDRRRTQYSITTFIARYFHIEKLRKARKSAPISRLACAGCPGGKCWSGKDLPGSQVHPGHSSLHFYPDVHSILEG